MKSLYNVAAPAKLNLFLHVTGRRNDGYHLLQSAFMLIDWHDTLHFELRADGQISREDLCTPLPVDDLVLRAARALQTSCGSPQGAHIGIEKRIPAQAGMGGGSSDAASTLLALNRLWKLDYSLERLSQIGLGRKDHPRRAATRQIPGRKTRPGAGNPPDFLRPQPQKGQ